MPRDIGRHGFNFFTSPDSLEYALCIIAIGWGLIQTLTSGVAIGVHESHATLDITRFQSLMGLFPLLCGSLGLLGLWTGRRWLRMGAALTLSPFWLLLSTYYLIAIPPVWGAVPVYGLDGIFELVIYGRLRYGLAP